MRRWQPRDIGLFGALGIAITAACFIVGIAYFLYWKSPNRKYDIERGGSASRNQALTIEDDAADTTSPVDAPSTKRKLQYLEEELKALGSLNKFNPEDLTDQALQLAPPEQPSF